MKKVYVPNLTVVLIIKLSFTDSNLSPTVEIEVGSEVFVNKFNDGISEEISSTSMHP